ncbi:MAG: Co2+/Mg2+ efflux protein ApaG [Myxococcota bacterium]
MSEATTDAIRVRVEPAYHPERSSPERRSWFFSYTVEIVNEGSRAVQLMARHWTITDGTGRVEEVRGPGVVGQTPVIPPGKTFVYTSYCPLPTPLGAMEGSYTIRREDGSTFEARIAPFVLEDPAFVN